MKTIERINRVLDLAKARGDQVAVIYLEHQLLKAIRIYTEETKARLTIR